MRSALYFVVGVVGLFIAVLLGYQLASPPMQDSLAPLSVVQPVKAVESSQAGAKREDSSNELRSVETQPLATGSPVVAAIGPPVRQEEVVRGITTTRSRMDKIKFTELRELLIDLGVDQTVTPQVELLISERDQMLRSIRDQMFARGNLKDRSNLKSQLAETRRVKEQADVRLEELLGTERAQTVALWEDAAVDRSHLVKVTSALSAAHLPLSPQQSQALLDAFYHARQPRKYRFKTDASFLNDVQQSLGDTLTSAQWSKLSETLSLEKTTGKK